MKEPEKTTPDLDETVEEPRPPGIDSAAILRTVPPVERTRRATIKLTDAHLCVECDSIYEGGAGRCPDCECAVAFSIARVIAPRDTVAPWRKA